MVKIGGAAKSLAGPVSALIEAVKNFDQTDGIDFVDAAGFRVIATEGGSPVTAKCCARRRRSMRREEQLAGR